MTNSVTFSVGVGGDGSTVDDSTSSTTGLANGGHKTRFVPALSQTVAVAANTVTQATNASSSASAASASQTAAAASAAAAANSASSVAITSTSTTSLAIAVASKTFTTQTAKQYVTGMFVVAASAADPTNYMFGQVTSYSGSTLIVNVTVIGGSGTLADWNISLAGTRGATGPTGPMGGVPSANTNTAGTSNIALTASSTGFQQFAPTTYGKHIALPDATTLSVGAIFECANTGGYPWGLRNSARTLLTGVAAGGYVLVTLRDNSSAAGVWSFVGNNLEPGLIGLDTLLGTTYNGTIKPNSCALTATLGLSLLTIAANGFAVVATDYTVGANGQGTPLTVDTAATINFHEMYRMSDTTAILFWDDGTNYNARVVTVSGADTPTPSCALGTIATTTTVIFSNVGNGLAQPQLIELDTGVLYASVVVTGSHIYGTKISVSGTTPTIGTRVDQGGTTVQTGITALYKATTTSAIVLFGDTTTTIKADSFSGSGTTVTWGTPSSAVTVQSGAGVHPSGQLTSSKVIAAYPNSTTTFNATCFSLSGSTMTANAELSIETGLAGTSITTYNNACISSSASADRYRPVLKPLTSTTMLLQYTSNNSGAASRCVVLSENGSGVLSIPTAVLQNGISRITDGTLTRAGAVLGIGTTEFVSLYQTGATEAFAYTLMPLKIAGTVITPGQGFPTGLHAQQSSGVVSFRPIRFSNGNYAVYGASSFPSGDYVPVFSTNGDYINFKGVIRTPLVFSAQSIPHALSATQMALTCVANATVSGTAQTRFIAIEVAP